MTKAVGPALNVPVATPRRQSARSTKADDATPGFASELQSVLASRAAAPVAVQQTAASTPAVSAGRATDDHGADERDSDEQRGDHRAASPDTNSVSPGVTGGSSSRPNAPTTVNAARGAADWESAHPSGQSEPTTRSTTTTPPNSTTTTAPKSTTTTSAPKSTTTTTAPKSTTTTTSPKSTTTTTVPKVCILGLLCL